MALASTDSGAIADLPISQDLYPRTSLRAATEAFSPYCRISESVPAGPASLALSLAVLPEHRSEGRAIIGEFLNFLLVDAVAGTSRSGEGE